MCKATQGGVVAGTLRMCRRNVAGQASGATGTYGHGVDSEAAGNVKQRFGRTCYQPVVIGHALGRALLRAKGIGEDESGCVRQPGQLSTGFVAGLYLRERQWYIYFGNLFAGILQGETCDLLPCMGLYEIQGLLIEFHSAKLH